MKLKPDDIDRIRERLEITRREYMAQRRLLLSCTLCPPHRGENVTRTAHGSHDRRYKDKRRHAKRHGRGR